MANRELPSKFRNALAHPDDAAAPACAPRGNNRPCARGQSVIFNFQFQHLRFQPEANADPRRLSCMFCNVCQSLLNDTEHHFGGRVVDIVKIRRSGLEAGGNPHFTRPLRDQSLERGDKTVAARNATTLPGADRAKLVVETGYCRLKFPQGVAQGLLGCAQLQGRQPQLYADKILTRMVVKITYNPLPLAGDRIQRAGDC
jgi:hypothetical protein